MTAHNTKCDEGETTPMTTSFGRVTSKRFLTMSRYQQIAYCREVAENYRDEVVLQGGGCGDMWQNPHGVGWYVCEESRDHDGPHRNGDAHW